MPPRHDVSYSRGQRIEDDAQLIGSRFAEPLGYPLRTVTRSMSRYSWYAMKI